MTKLGIFPSFKLIFIIFANCMQVDISNIITRLCTVIIMGCTFSSHAYAQPKSMGTSYSFSGMALSYEHYLSNDSFAEISLKGETGEMFMGRTEIPGVSASFTWNMKIYDWTSRNGNTVSIFAGPGLTAGWCEDLKKPSGGFIGLKGRVGGECSFNRKVIISVSVSPVIGTHAVLLEDSIRMTYYRNGLLGAVIPEIGIKYRFGR